MIEAYSDNELTVGDLIPTRGKYQLVLDVQSIELTDPPRMTYKYHFVWVEPTGDDLISMKQALVDSVKEIHDNKILEGYFTSFGFRVDIKPNNVTDWSAGLQLLNLSGATEIKVGDYENQTHTLTSTQYIRMCAEVGAYLQFLRSKKWANREAVLAAPTVEEAAIAATNWSV